MTSTETADHESDQPVMPFTGERFTPECEREIWYEHYHRYAFACPLVKGKTVLDAASGEGYGTHLLATTAARAVGVDVDSDTIAHARRRYGAVTRGKVPEFIQASCDHLPFEDSSFDVVVSFETLEHLSAQEAMLAEFERVLKPNGFIIISTPDKAIYSDATGYDNPYHVKELYRHEFQALLDEHWPAQQWLGQKMAFFSVLWHQQRNGLSSMDARILGKDGALLAGKIPWVPVYHVVVAAKKAEYLPPVADVHFFADEPESVYGHYHAVIRAHIRAEQELHHLKNALRRWHRIPVLGRWLKYLEKKHGI